MEQTLVKLFINVIKLFTISLTVGKSFDIIEIKKLLSYNFYLYHQNKSFHILKTFG